MSEADLLIERYKTLVRDLFRRRAEGPLPDEEEATLAAEQVDLWERIPEEQRPDLDEWIEEQKRRYGEEAAAEDRAVSLTLPRPLYHVLLTVLDDSVRVGSPYCASSMEKVKRVRELAHRAFHAWRKKDRRKPS